MRVSAAQGSTQVAYDGVKTFTATKAMERETLGETVSSWLRQSGVEIVDQVVLQSSDVAYHALTIILFYRKTK